MKKFVLLALGCSLFVISGCATGYKYSSYEPGKDGTMRYHSTNGTLFSETPTPVQLATAYKIKKEVDNQELLIQNMKRGEMITASNARKMLVVVNNHPRNHVWFYDPLIPGREITVTPRGGMNFVEIGPNLKEITFYVSGGGKFAHRLRAVKSPIVIGGINADYHVKYE